MDYQDLTTPPPWSAWPREMHGSMTAHYLVLKYACCGGNLMREKDDTLWQSVNSRSHGLHRRLIVLAKMPSAYFVDFRDAERRVQSQTEVQLTQAQFDAILALCRLSFSSRTMIETMFKQLNKGKYDLAQAMIQEAAFHNPHRTPAMIGLGDELWHLWLVPDTKTDGTQ